MERAHQILKSLGHANFRGKQKEAISGVLSGRDVFVIMPTGGGKTMCYLIPALMSPGVTLVISPLIALMQDQVQNLQARNVSCEFISSTQKLKVREAILNELFQAEESKDIRTKLLFITPEFLTTARFWSLARRLVSRQLLSLVAVDEAHCVSAWGHDFRPAYARIGSTLDTLCPNVPILALTATAAARVREDVGAQLRMRNPLMLVGSYNRPNIHYSIRYLDKLRSSSQAACDEAEDWCMWGGGALEVDDAEMDEDELEDLSLRFNISDDERFAIQMARQAIREHGQFVAVADGNSISVSNSIGNNSSNSISMSINNSNSNSNDKRICNGDEKDGEKNDRTMTNGCRAVTNDGRIFRYPSCIIYCLRRETTEAAAALLRRRGILCAAYHAQLPDKERTRVLEEWKKGSIPVVAATIAFGMGIDKPDVRLVVHLNLPKTMESFYQESGRAGRDGRRSYSVVIYSETDRRRMDFILRKEEERWRVKAREAAGKTKGCSAFGKLSLLPSSSLPSMISHSSTAAKDSDGSSSKRPFPEDGECDKARNVRQAKMMQGGGGEADREEGLKKLGSGNGSEEKEGKEEETAEDPKFRSKCAVLEAEAASRAVRSWEHFADWVQKAACRRSGILNFFGGGDESDSTMAAAQRKPKLLFGECCDFCDDPIGVRLLAGCGSAPSSRAPGLRKAYGYKGGASSLAADQKTSMNEWGREARADEEFDDEEGAGYRDGSRDFDKDGQRDEQAGLGRMVDLKGIAAAERAQNAALRAAAAAAASSTNVSSNSGTASSNSSVSSNSIVSSSAWTASAAVAFKGFAGYKPPPPPPPLSAANANKSSSDVYWETMAAAEEAYERRSKAAALAATKSGNVLDRIQAFKSLKDIELRPGSSICSSSSSHHHQNNSNSFAYNNGFSHAKNGTNDDVPGIRSFFGDPSFESRSKSDPSNQSQASASGTGGASGSTSDNSFVNFLSESRRISVGVFERSLKATVAAAGLNGYPSNPIRYVAAALEYRNYVKLWKACSDTDLKVAESKSLDESMNYRLESSHVPRASYISVMRSLQFQCKTASSLHLFVQTEIGSDFTCPAKWMQFLDGKEIKDSQQNRSNDRNIKSCLKPEVVEILEDESSYHPSEKIEGRNTEDWGSKNGTLNSNKTQSVLALVLEAETQFIEGSIASLLDSEQTNEAKLGLDLDTLVTLILNMKKIKISVALLSNGLGKRLQAITKLGSKKALSSGAKNDLKQSQVCQKVASAAKEVVNEWKRQVAEEADSEAK